MKELTEHQIQASIVDWCHHMSFKYPCLDWIHAIPNGGKRHIVTATKLKREGVKAGIPDLFLPEPMAPNWHGLYIEVKKKGGKVSKPQKSCMDYLQSIGYMTCVVYSLDDAIREIEKYLEND